MTFRSRKAALAMLAAGVAFMLSPVAAALAQTAEETELGVFDVLADATGIGGSMGDPSASPYPVAAGLIPNAVAQLGSGPSGRAVSSIAWPGPLLSNAGSLANVVGTPLPPEVVANANYPVKAEANAGGGGRDEQTVGPMAAVVDGAESAARTALSDFNAPGLVSAARVVTKSRSFLEDGAAVAIAESDLQGVEIAGLIQIESIRTIAKGTTNGVEATTEHSVVVSGVTVGGQGATLDHEGLHLGDQSNPNPLEPVLDGAGAALEGLGMRAFVTKPLEQRADGGTAVLHSGAVVFDWNFFDSGQIVTIVLGGASVRVQATPGSSFGTGDAGGDFFSSPDGFGGGTATLGGGGGGGGGSFSPSTASDFGPVSSGGTGGSVAGGGVAPPPGGDALSFSSASAVSDRVPLGWMIIGMVGMAMVGTSLHGMRASALAGVAAGTTCPFERGAQ
jgi:hypothetical protein